MASKKDFKVVKAAFAAWVEHDGSVSFITENGKVVVWKTKAAAEKALRVHWAPFKVFVVKGRFLK